MVSTSSCAELPSSPAKADALAVSVDAKLMVTTGHGDCQQLKDLLSKEDSTTIVVVMAPSNQASRAKPSPAVINPLLLSSACSGSWQELEYLVNIGDSQAQPTVEPSQPFVDLITVYNSGSCSNRSIATPKASDDVEAFLNLPAVSVLEGITVNGDTALHVVATYGDGDGFLMSARIIYNKANHLLFVQNRNGDTPLHCAARAGKFRMVSHLISLARGEDTTVNRVKELLETENKLQETALHQAIRIGNNDIVKLLMEENPQLASFPKDGPSPLFLAILLEEDIIVQTLYNTSHMILSYSGQNGKNALHAAVLRGRGSDVYALAFATTSFSPELTKMLLEWNNDLTAQVDENGSTPLHFAATLLHQSQRGSICCQLLEANPAALYQSDNDGLFPIHVAASVGETGTIAMFLNKSPSIAGLHNNEGKTFLHLAVEKKKVKIVGYACKNRSISWILNMQDYDGNTALHLAIQAGSLRMFCALFGNQQVHLNLTNKKGQTPLDISRYKISPGIFYHESSETKIHLALTATKARNGGCRRDHFEENYAHKLKHNEKEESKKVRESIQTLCIGAVLMATVAFSAIYALPGGYRADDHTNGGTPTLAGSYAFDAFIIASTFTFLLSSVAILGLMYSGYSILNPQSRKTYLVLALYAGSTSVTCFAAAFSLGVYMVLAPVAHKTAVAICVITPVVVLFNKMEFWLKWALLARPLCTRIGLIRTAVLAATSILFNLFMDLWPFIFIFVWAAYTRNQL